MIFTDSRWGILVGGTNFMVFFMKKVWENDACYHHIVASSSHRAFPPGPVQGLPGPCLILVLIALLLHDNPTASYPQPPIAGFITPYVGDRSTRAARNTRGGTQSKDPAQGGSKTPGRSGRGAQSKTPVRGRLMTSEPSGRTAAVTAGAEATKELRSRTVLISVAPEASFPLRDRYQVSSIQCCPIFFPMWLTTSPKVLHALLPEFNVSGSPDPSHESSKYKS